MAAGPGVRGGVGGSSNPALPRSSPRSACDHTRSVSASLCTRTSMSTCMFLCPSPSASLYLALLLAYPSPPPARRQVLPRRDEAREPAIVVTFGGVEAQGPAWRAGSRPEPAADDSKGWTQLSNATRVRAGVVPNAHPAQRGAGEGSAQTARGVGPPPSGDHSVESGARGGRGRSVRAEQSSV